MFLKSLTLKGFKSFADTATLEFEPGVTVVVGPNGSGKSNIVDAVAWVLGAQGPRTLRSSKMEDVIFAGTPKRARLGRTEVSLTIDNSAGLLPIDFSEVCITRALWRTGESEYSINGAPCRLLDIQELLSDTGVGRQQHTIVSQWQLDAILSARPEDRRAVVEEAAGISKHRRRKEKAERRLEATEGALLRAQDLLKEVRRQLRPLERQAEAARRHAEVTDELTALRRYLYGRELGLLRSRLGASDAAKADLASTEQGELSALTGLDASVTTAEERLDTVRRDAEQSDLSELVSAAEGLKARAHGLIAVLQERSRSIERERTAAIDLNVVATLEAEAATLGRQLADADREAEELLPLEAELAGAEDAQLREVAEVEERFGGRGGFEDGGAHEEGWPGGQPIGDEPTGDGPAGDGLIGGGPIDGAHAGAAPGEQAGQVRAELLALAKSAEHAEAELSRIAARAEAVEARRRRLNEEMERAAAVVREVERSAGELSLRAERAAEEVGLAEQALAAAQEARRRADSDRQRWSARAEALAEALDEARARAGARRLASVDGALGALVELVQVDEGNEPAFEAAAGEALSAVLMEDEAAARDGLAHLAGQKASGAVMPLPNEPDGGLKPGLSAVSDLNGLLPEGAGWLRQYVHSSVPSVAELLDRLLARAVVVEGGWQNAVDLAARRPDLVIVSREGDRCASGIWRTGLRSSGVTGAALAEARTALHDAIEAAERAEEGELQAKAGMDAARHLNGEAQKVLAAQAASLRAANESLTRAGPEVDEAASEADELSNQVGELRARRGRDQVRAAALKDLLPALEAAAAEAAERAASERAARDRLAERAGAVATLRRDFEVRASALEERRALLGRRLREVEQRLARTVAEREQAAHKRERLEAEQNVVSRLGTFVSARLSALEAALEKLRELRLAEASSLRSASEDLERLRRERAGVERELAKTREQLSRNELESAQSRARMESITETVRRDLDCEPEALEGAECPVLPPGTSAPARARELERELRLMGPVNPLALEEHAALEERHQFLEGQLHDVSAARRELSKVIKAIDAEIITVFKAAYDDVAENFGKLVATLFPSGQGALSLTDPANILESGVDLEVRPAGKNIRRLSLLSGGERSLVALAFLFSVFRSRPSPFYMMDEVEAALDDVNLHRFLDLLNEFREEAQLLVVSHQKRTMEAADCLYGVSIPPGGSSIVVSEKIDRRRDGEASTSTEPANSPAMAVSASANPAVSSSGQ
ncbi:MAG TPA: AAA family ATPase [Acidimicrobiales bacterium]|nr:AAA family ATPase [Acidimicrobiales bacterium]